MPNEVLAQGSQGDAVARLHEALNGQEFQIPAAELSRQTFGPGTKEAVLEFQRKHGLPATGEVDAATAASLGLKDVVGAVPAPDFLVLGSVQSNSFAALGGLAVRIVDRRVGASIPVADATTAADGSYRTSFPAATLARLGKTEPDLQAHVYSGDALLASSEVRYHAANPAVLNVVLSDPVRGLRSEYETLTASIATAYTGPLSALQESGEREDVTYLANRTGWDARAVVMAALAEQFSAPAGTVAAGPGATIPAPFLYALFRAGFPANAADLYRTDPAAVQAVWQQSLAQGVIPQALSNQVESAAQTFRERAATTALTAAPSIGLSTLKDILDVSLPNDPERQQQFSTLFAEQRHDPSAFWSAVEQKLGKPIAIRAQLDSQICYLTVNNAALVAKLHQAEASPVTSPLDLVHRGYHSAAKWLPLMESVPPEIPGDTVDEKKNNYANLLAAHVRLAFPTAVIANLVSTGAAPLAGGADVVKNVTRFLTDHQGQFEIGAEAVEGYLKRNKLEDSVDTSVVTEIKRLQRVYQITPNDQALSVLLENKLDSAFAITRYDQDGFVRAFGKAMGGDDVAKRTYFKAAQVHGAIVNIATAYVISQKSPALGADGQGPVLEMKTEAASPNYPISANPTLESLVGSMDFCSCDECRSIMSPAAYMVNLLEYIDSKSPHPGYQNPQAVLFSRRPDLQYLPLTCENTNVALPYIDLCNETMEYFVANTLSLVSPDYTGHDTGTTITSDELMASPQYVNDAAYATLQSAWFPPPLPFHRPLSLLRLHFDKLGLELQDVMAALRPSDAVERGGAVYGWRDILMEQIGISRQEYRILTDSTLKLQDLYGYPALSDGAVLNSLTSVRDFSRRTGVSYLDLFSILQTQFINPNCALIPRLQKLGVAFTTLEALKKGTLSVADFKALLPPTLDATYYGGANASDLDAVVAWVTDGANYARIMGLIIITDPAAKPDLCSAEALQFRYANPDNAANRLHAIDFVRLIRFIRLWRKLGLTIQQTDDIISALYPPASRPTGNEVTDLPLQDQGFLILLPRIGFVFQVLDQLLLSARDSLSNVLACWAPIGTTGDRSLYSAMFANATVLQNDPAFADDGYGNVLSSKTETLLTDAHIATLRAAFNVTAEEFTLITQYVKFSKATTILTLDNISAIYRIAWLSRTLQISVAEFLLLIQYTGLDPFAPPDPAPTPPAEPPVIRFIRLVQAMKAASLQPVQALYLIWNQDISGLSVPPDAQMTGLAAALRADFAAVESQFKLVDDPSGSVAKSLMELAYGSSTTDFFFGLINNTFTTSVPYGNPQPTLAQPILDAASGRLTYDDLRKQLAFAGVLDPAMEAAIHAAIVANGNYAPLLAALAAIFTASHQTIDPFFNAYPELGPGPGTPYGIYAASNDPPQSKRTVLLANLLTDLKTKRKQEQARAGITAAAGVDPAFAPAILMDAAVLKADGGTAPAISDLTSIEKQGLSVQFFLNDNLAVPADVTIDAVADLDYEPGATNPLPPGNGGGPIAAVWSGYLSADQDGDYNLQIGTDTAAAVTVQLNGATVPLAQNGGVWTNLSEISLVAGQLAPVVITVTSVKSTVHVSWQSKGRGWQTIPGSALYSQTLISQLRATYVRFLKATSVASGLSLTANEIAWLARNADISVGGQGWLSALAVSASPGAADFAALRDLLGALLDFARIKQELSPKDERFLQVLQDPAAQTQNGASGLLTLTGWTSDSRDALLKQFFGDTNLAHLSQLENFRRVHDAFALIKASGISASALIAAATNDPAPAIATDLQSALRARYAESDWLAVIKPVNNAIRQLQRDALVAYILQQLGDAPATADINTPDRLFEYFLMDVQMEPCMQTSRIRHALSSIQLFIERCLRNLEPSVSPSDIDGSRWPVMKRFRLWQSNLETFLWPERWLYPELRDNQSPPFQQTTKTLLQSDMTDDAAAAAYLSYLTALESVAKLEPCGIFYQPADPTAAPGLGDEYAHVIARSSGATAKYYYRELLAGTWTPWQETGLAIEDVPVTPFVWNDRLLLFWIQILKQNSTTVPTADPAPPGPDSNHPKLADSTAEQLGAKALTSAGKQAPALLKIPVQAALCWSEFYNGKWQPTKTSDLKRPTLIGTFDPIGPGAFDRLKYQLQVAPASYAADKLVASITRSGQTLNSNPPGFLLYNTHSVPPSFEDVADNPNRGAINWRVISTSYSGSGGLVDPNVAFPPSATPNKLTIAYNQMVAVPTPHRVQAYQNDVLTSPVGQRIVVPQAQSAFDGAWELPFFFEDSRNVFYVTTRQAMVPLNRYLGLVSQADRSLVLGSLISSVIVPPLEERAPSYKPPIDPSDPALAQPDAMRRFVSEDAHIRFGLATTAPVSFQGAQIGPSGRLKNNLERG